LGDGESTVNYPSLGIQINKYCVYYSVWTDVQEQQRQKMFPFLFHMTYHISRDTDQQCTANGFELKYKHCFCRNINSYKI